MILKRSASMSGRQSKPKTLFVAVEDTVQVTDKIVTYKQWFNGVKKFFTVKVLPPRK